MSSRPVQSGEELGGGRGAQKTRGGGGAPERKRLEGRRVDADLREDWSHSSSHPETHPARRGEGVRWRGEEVGD